MAIKGNLQDINVADLIQLNCQAGYRARLSAKSGGEELALYFDGGEVVHAQGGALQGEEAVYRLLTWDTGTFEVEQGVEPPARTIGVPWSALVMEGMRRLDEGRLQRARSTEGKESTVMAEPQKRSERLAEALRRIVDNSTDIEGVAVISGDGLIIAAELPARMDRSRVGAVAAAILSLSGRSVGQLERGELLQTLVQGTAGNVVITHAGGRAALVALTGKDVNLGMVFLEAREGAQAVAGILG